MATKENFTPPEFKANALKLEEKTSVPSAEKALGANEYQLHTRRAAGNKKKSVSERKAVLTTESTKLIRQLASLAEELEILKNTQKA